MHGRNMDWNLDQHLLKYVISADFVRGGKKVFTGTFIAGRVLNLFAKFRAVVGCRMVLKFADREGSGGPASGLTWLGILRNDSE